MVHKPHMIGYGGCGMTDVVLSPQTSCDRRWGDVEKLPKDQTGDWGILGEVGRNSEVDTLSTPKGTREELGLDIVFHWLGVRKLPLMVFSLFPSCGPTQP